MSKITLKLEKIIQTFLIIEKIFFKELNFFKLEVPNLNIFNSIPEVL